MERKPMLSATSYDAAIFSCPKHVVNSDEQLRWGTPVERPLVT